MSNDFDFSDLDSYMDQPTSEYSDYASYLNRPQAEPKNDSWEATKGFKAGLDQLQGLGGGMVALLGDAFGSESMQEWGLDTYQKNMEEAAAHGGVTSFSEAEGFDEHVDWALYQVGNSIPMFASMMATGGVGALAAKKVAQKGIQKYIEKQVAKGATAKAAAEMAAKRIAGAASAGGAAGTYLSSNVMSSGEIYGELSQMPEPEGSSRWQTALAHGSASAALDALPVMAVLKRLGIGDVAGKQIKDSFLKSTAKIALAEGTTEGMQGLIEEHAKNWLETNKSLFAPSQWNKLQDPLLWTRVGDEAAAGVIGGVTINSATYLLDKRPTADKMRDRREAVAAAGGDALDQANAASEELAKGAAVDDALNQLNERGGEGRFTDSTAVDFEVPEMPNVEPRQNYQENGSEIDFEPVNRADTLSMATDGYQYDGGIDFDTTSRTDQLASGVERRIAGQEFKDRSLLSQGLLPSPETTQAPAGYLGDDANKPFKENTNQFGQSPMQPLMSPRMDSDPVARQEEMRLRSEEEMRKFTKRKREAVLPPNLKDQRLLNPAYKQEMIDAVATAEQELKRPQGFREKVDSSVDDLLTAIAKNGGINSKDLTDDAFDWQDLKQHQTGVKRAFHSNGRSLDDMAEVLVEDGYMQERDPHALAEMIDDSLRGTPHYSSNVDYAKIEASPALKVGREMGMTTKQIRNALSKMLNGEKLGDRQLEFAKGVMDQIDAQRSEQIPDLMKQREKLNEARRFKQQVIEAIRESGDSFKNARTNIPLDAYAEIEDAEFEAYDDVSPADIAEATAEVYAEENGLTKAQIDQLSLTYPETESYVSAIYREVANAKTKPRTESESEGDSQRLDSEAQSRQAENQDDSDGGNLQAGDGGREQGLLETYTEKDIAEREAKAEAIRKREEAEALLEEEKAKADSGLSSFSLTGSDRQADANPNQADIFDSVSDQPIKPTGNRRGDTETYEFPDGSIQSRSDDEVRSDTEKATTEAEQATSETVEAEQQGLDAIESSEPEHQSVGLDDRELTIKDISEKAFVVKGKTIKHKGKLKSLGGKWNAKNKGWMFPKTKEASIRESLGDLVSSAESKQEIDKISAPDWWNNRTGAERFSVLQGAGIKGNASTKWDSLTGEQQRSLDEQWGDGLRIDQDATLSKPKKPTVSKNKVFTEDAAEKARALLKAKLGQMNSGLDPEMVQAGITLAGYHIEKGARTFAAYSRAMVGDLGDMVKPYLKSWYMAAKYDPRTQEFEGMSGAAEVESANIEEVLAEESRSDQETELSDFLFGRLDEVTDNRQLKKAVGQYFGVSAVEVTQQQMKEAQEALELALVKKAREIVSESRGDQETFDALLAMYKQQPNLNVRSSTSMANQAYSTPAPLAFLASRMAGIDANASVYEPTAGNGMLVLGADQANTATNELNDQRVSHLKKLGFEPTQNDATDYVPKQKGFDAVIMNPPFGKLKDSDGNLQPIDYEGYKITSIDHLIAAKALEAMKDDGRAAIIIGADKTAGKIGSSDRIFFNWLESHYNVTEHVEVDGSLYNRQGAGWPVRVIAINGRQKSNKLSPASGTIQRLETWEEIYERFNESVDSNGEFNGSGTGSISSNAPKLADLNETDLQELLSGQDQSSDRGSRGSGSSNTTRTADRPASNAGTNSRNDSGKRGDARNSQQSETQGQTTNERSEEARTDSNPASVDAKLDGKPSKPVSASGYQTIYKSKSSGFNEEVLIPNNLAGALSDALDDLESRVGDIDNFVMSELGYSSKKDLHKAFMGLQIDGIALSIDSLKNNKGAIIADQTGVGKGRQAAAMIRYALRNDRTPVFVSVTPNLFTDMYEDLADIGTHDVRPFIFNANETIKTKGKKLFKSTGRQAAFTEMKRTGRLPDDRNAVFLTYTQLGTDNDQRAALAGIKNPMFILDESHNASGNRTTRKKVGGKSIEVQTAAGFLYEAIRDQPTIYLSATYAKRPDNMPIYYRTSLMDAVDSPTQLVDAVSSGGLPLQGVMATMLARVGQLMRRERSFEGISIPVVYDMENASQHRELSDSVTSGLRGVQNADWYFHNVFLEEYKDEIKSRLGFDVSGAGNKASATIDHSNFNAVLHNYVRQLLLGLKAERAAEQAIEAFKAGKKPVIALENTMGAFLEEFTNDAGIKQGKPVDADYRDVLLRALERTRRISIKDSQGNKKVADIPLSALDEKTFAAYAEAREAIESMTVDGLALSPIDIMRQRLSEAGMSVAELTGRDLALDYSVNPPKLTRKPSTEKDKRLVVDRFNTGKLDALIINKSGSTGLSIHASEKFTDKRPRHMIVAQTMQDVNILIQMLGRINRTGQVELPTYELLGVTIPAEKRQLAVGSRKLKSLNANTSANDESDTSFSVPDMLNKYGDKVAAEYLAENPDIAALLDVDSTGDAYPGLMLKVTGRMAMLEVSMQEEIYGEIEPAYSALIEYLTKTGQNDLIASTLDMDAKIISSNVVYEGKKPDTIFGGNTTLHKVDSKYQGKPPTVEDVEEALSEALDGRSASEITQELVSNKKSQFTSAVEKLNASVASKEQALSSYQSKPKPNQKEKTVARLMDELDKARIKRDEYRANGRKVLSQLERLSVGTKVKLDLGDDVVNGLILGLKDSHKGTGDPLAASKLRISVMVSSGIRTVDVPIKQMHSKNFSEDGIIVEEFNGNTPLSDLFGKEAANLRETRYVATGNLIAGSAKLKGGRIVNFTDDTGKTHQGILMPKVFGKKGEAEEVSQDDNFSIRDAKVAAKFLNATKNEIEFSGGIFSNNQKIRLTRDGRGWVIRVPKANKDPMARDVKFNKALIDTMGQDFYGSGYEMEGRFDDGKLEKVLEKLLDIVPMYALPSLRNEWINAGGTGKAKADNSFSEPARFSLDSNSDSVPSDYLPISKKDAEGVINRITRDWVTGDRDVVLVDSFDSLPSSIQEEARNANAENQVWGVFHDDKLYLVRDKHKTEEALEQTIFHEAYGHYGLKKLFGKLLDLKLNEIYMAIGGREGIKKYGERHGFDAKAFKEYDDYLAQSGYPDHIKRAILTDEMLAHMAQNSKPNIKRKIMEFLGQLRAWLREHGFAKLSKMNDADLFYVLRRSRNAMKNLDSKSGKSQTRFMVAYHGTPHSFDEFSLDAMGTGEGAQAYGWGMYFAGKREVAEYYRDALANKPEIADVLDRWGVDDSVLAGFIAEDIVQKRGDLEKVASNVEKLKREDDDEWLSGNIDKAVKLLRERPDQFDTANLGNLYEVDIPEDSELLDFDKPLSEQSSKVIKALRSLNDSYINEVLDSEPRSMDGGEYWSFMGDTYDTKREALEDHSIENVIRGQRGRIGDSPKSISHALNDVGIKGLRYLDGISRSLGRGNHNYVIWDESAVTVKAVNDQPRFSKGREDVPMFSMGRDPETEEALDRLGLNPKEQQNLLQKISAFIKELWENKFNGDWRVYQRAYEGLFDGLIGIKRAEDEVGVTDYAESGYVGARLATGVADVMSAVLNYGAPEWRGGVIQFREGTEGLMSILSDLGTDLDAWLAWMAAHRAEQLMDQGRENNLTEEDIRALKRQAQGKEQLFKDVKARYNALNTAMLDLAEEAGLIKPNSRSQWESEWYVPFYRQSEVDGNEAALLGPRTKRGLSHQSAGIKALKGGEMATNDLLENILQNWIKLTDSSMKNMALLKAVDNLKDSRFLTNESMRFERAAIPKSQVNKLIKDDREYREQVAAMLGLGRNESENKVIDELASLDSESYDMMWALTAPSEPDIIRVSRNGKHEYYRVNDDSVLRAFTHINTVGSSDPITKSARYFKRLLTTGVTASPDFILRNFIRDAVHAWAINPDGFKFALDSGSGMKGAWKEDSHYRELMFSGASFQGGYVHGTDPDRSAQIVRRALEAEGLSQPEIERYESSLLNTGAKLTAAIEQGWQKYRNVGDKVENANRLATFKKAVESGKPMAQAVFEAKDLMDYSLRGNFQALIWFTDVIPFLNARMQGLSKLGRAAKENPQQIKSAGMKIAAFSAALALLNMDDERYEEIPDWDKDANWHFFIGDEHFRIPKPFEIGVIFGTMPERFVHTVFGNQDNEKLAWSIKHNLLHTFNFNPIPQFILPVSEVVANRSFFFDTPIEGMADEGKMTEARYNERTSSTAVELGRVAKWAGVSPKQLEHLWAGYTGTLGTYALMLSDVFVNHFTDREKPAWGLEDYPVIKSFYRGSGPAKSTQYATDFYDRFSEVDEIARTIKAYRKEGRIEDARELQRSSKDKLKYRGALGRARKQMGDLNKQIERISRSKSYTREVKRLRIQKLQKRKNELAKRIAELTDD